MSSAATQPLPRSSGASQPESSYSNRGLPPGGGGLPPIGPFVFPAICLMWAAAFWGWEVLLRFLLFLGVFLGAIWAINIAFFLLPLRPTWHHHKRFAKYIKPAPILVASVAFLTNYFPTELIERIYTPRLFGAYLASVLAVVYQGLFRLGCPAYITSSNLRSNPWLRYVLTLLAVTFVLISSILTLTLLPATISERPEDWWRVFWIKPASQ